MEPRGEKLKEEGAPPFGSYAPFISPYPREETPPELPSVKERIRTDLLMLSLGGFAGLLTANYGERSGITAMGWIFWLPATVLMFHQGWKQKTMFPHVGIAALMSGSVATIVFISPEIFRDTDVSKGSHLLAGSVEVVGLLALPIALFTSKRLYPKLFIRSDAWESVRRALCFYPFTEIAGVSIVVLLSGDWEGKQLPFITASWLLTILWSIRVAPRFPDLLAFGSVSLILNCLSTYSSAPDEYQNLLPMLSLFGGFGIYSLVAAVRVWVARSRNLPGNSRS